MANKSAVMRTRKIFRERSIFRLLRVMTQDMDKLCFPSQRMTPMILSKYVYPAAFGPPLSPRTFNRVKTTALRREILQWTNFKKSMILAICAAYSFLGNSALVGPSVYIGIYAEEFGVTPTIASGLISYPNLAFGFGSLLLVPLYLKIGRRPVMLLSLVCFLGGLIGASRASTFQGLMVARVFHGLGSGVCEALPVQLVNDIFFLHERGKRIGYYTVCLCLGATGPLYAGYMLAGGYSWRLFFYVEIAFAAALLILAIIFVEETSYKRVIPAATPAQSDTGDAKEAGVHQIEEATVVPPRKTFLQQLKPFEKIDHEAEFFMTMIRPFTYFTVPAVFWVITTYGIYIGLGALAFNYTFPLLIVKPPYSWAPENSGLIAVANAVGFLSAVPFTFTSDRLAAHLTRRNNGIREAEMRLPVMLPAMLIAPAGLVVYGLTAERELHWMGFFAGVAMCNWGAYFYFSFTLAYAVDSYNANTSEMLIAMNLGKQAISFGMGLKLLDWILERGFAVVIAGAFGAVLLANNLLLPVFWFCGKSIRRYTANSWLGGWHNKKAGAKLTH
ncbi:MFS general substrate transporter [Venustampulla echinocandica]|uniref:MFS general substrate transporter n=1 Tax=Venustampulla echinocandica TaxID=2656787 RepID=A0A370T8U6_9HELO|nr:MFS general substrate transporter [Venustampulla echinocandica]RDL29906.1 MFS general substrate transporter [Venustampulla echinocandica]